MCVILCLANKPTDTVLCLQAPSWFYGSDHAESVRAVGFPGFTGLTYVGLTAATTHTLPLLADIVVVLAFDQYLVIGVHCVCVCVCVRVFRWADPTERISVLSK